MLTAPSAWPNRVFTASTDHFYNGCLNRPCVALIQVKGPRSSDVTPAMHAMSVGPSMGVMPLRHAASETNESLNQTIEGHSDASGMTLSTCQVCYSPPSCRCFAQIVQCHWMRRQVDSWCDTFQTCWFRRCHRCTYDIRLLPPEMGLAAHNGQAFAGGWPLQMCLKDAAVFIARSRKEDLLIPGSQQG